MSHHLLSCHVVTFRSQRLSRVASRFAHVRLTPCSRKPRNPSSKLWTEGDNKRTADSNTGPKAKEAKALKPSPDGPKEAKDLGDHVTWKLDEHELFVTVETGQCWAWSDKGGVIADDKPICRVYRGAPRRTLPPHTAPTTLLRSMQAAMHCSNHSSTLRPVACKRHVRYAQNIFRAL